MAEQKNNQGIKNYADGWITEREGTEVPGFLKLAFPVIALGCIAYIFLYMYGETTHSGRGMLVQKFNEVSQTSAPFMYGVGALAVIFAVIVAVFAFRKSH